MRVNLTDGRIAKTFILFALPVLLTYFLNTLYTSVDFVIVGNFTDKIAMTAVNSGTNVMFVITSIITGLTTGTTVLVGQYWGAKEISSLKKAIGNAICLFIIIAFFLTILMCSLSWVIPMLMTSKESLWEAQIYLFICCSGIPFIVGYNLISAILRGLGNSTAPFIFVLVATIVNISLDLLFIAVFNMRVVGAALATFIGQGVSFASGLVYLKIKHLGLGFKKEDIRISKTMSQRNFKFGLPIAIQDGLVVLSFVLILIIVSSKGDTYNASMGITDRITSFAFVPLSAFGAVVSTSTAQNMGAYKINRVKRYMYFGILMSAIFGLLFFVLYILIPGQLAALFTRDQQLITNSIPYTKGIAYDCLICIFIFCINAVFIGSGHTLYAMLQNLISTFLVRIPLAYLFWLVFNLDIFYVGICYALGSSVSLLLCIIYYLTNKWQYLKKVVVTQDLYLEKEIN